ncbi:MAG: BlaI/MecI/CopY family transcriptional regulator, partial [Bacteroidota bacterium]
VATIVKILANKKGFLDSELIGNTHLYRPTKDFESYKDGYFDEMKKNYFGNSFPKMLAHFAKKEDLTEAEKEELIKIIKSGNS